MPNGKLVLVEKDFVPLSITEDALYDRVYARTFDRLLDRRDSLRKQKDEAWKIRLSDPTNFQQVQEQKDLIKRLVRFMFGNRSDIEAYKDITARDYVLPMIPEIEATFQDYKGETIGRAVRAATHRVGSREWLEERQHGLGGSDIGKMLGIYETRYSASKQEEIIESDWGEVYSSKVDHITDEQVEDQIPDEGPLFRGNTWESVIFHRFVQLFDDLTVMHTKSTWRNGNATLNVDGLISNRKDGKINGVFEAKTGSFAEAWEDGIPLKYLAQVTHYMYHMDLEYAYVAVLLDDQELRVYYVDLDDVLIPCQVYPDGATPQQIAEYSDKCYNMMQEARAKRLADEAEARENAGGDRDEDAA